MTVTNLLTQAIVAEVAHRPASVPEQVVCEVIAQRLAVDGAGLCLTMGMDSRLLLAASDETISHLIDLEFTLGEGPGATALDTGIAVLVPDLRQGAQRWPVLAESLLAIGVRAVFTIPLRIAGTTLGLLSAYRRTPGPLSIEELAQLSDSTGLIATMFLRHAADAADGPNTPLGLRVPQATGVVMAQLGVTADTALARLRGQAFLDGRTITEISVQILDFKLRLPPD